MKGTYFQKPLEFNLFIEGESWGQGDLIKGQLKVKNHSPEDIDLSSFGVQLAWGEDKKLKDKSKDSFSILSEKSFDKEVLKKEAEESLEWEFKLGEDSPITEKKASLYLLYGNEEGVWQGGQLHLKIVPHKMITDFFNVFETFFRFKVKDFKNKKGFIDAKMIPPNNKDFISVKSLNCQIKTVDKNLDLKFIFKLKKLNYAQNEMTLKDETKTIEKSLGPKEYLMYGKDMDQDKIQKLLQSVLDEVKSTNKF